MISVLIQKLDQFNFSALSFDNGEYWNVSINRKIFINWEKNKYISDYDIYQANEAAFVYLGRFPTRLTDGCYD